MARLHTWSQYKSILTIVAQSRIKNAQVATQLGEQRYNFDSNTSTTNTESCSVDYETIAGSRGSHITCPPAYPDDPAHWKEEVHHFAMIHCSIISLHPSRRYALNGPLRFVVKLWLHSAGDSTARGRHGWLSLAVTCSTPPHHSLNRALLIQLPVAELHDQCCAGERLFHHESTRGRPVNCVHRTEESLSIRCKARVEDARNKLVWGPN